MRSNNTSKMALSGGIIACIIWASAVIVVQRLANAFGPISAIGWESLIGGMSAATLLTFRKDAKSVFKHPKKYYLFAGLTWTFYQVLFFVAISLVPSKPHLVVVGLINYLWPILTFLFSIPILGKKFSKLAFLGLPIALIGIYIAKTSLSINFTQHISSMLTAYPFAYSIAFLAAIMWGIYSNVVKRYACPKSQSALPIFMITSALPLIVLGLVLGESSIINFTNCALLVFWSLITTIAVLLWDFGIRHGNVTHLAVVSMFIPLLSTLITCYQSELPISAAIILAGILVSAGGWLCQKSEIQ